MTADRVPAAGQVTVAGEAERCGCGEHYTRARVDGDPWRWACFLAHEDTTIDFYRDLKLPEYAPRVMRGGKMTDPYWCPRLADVQDIVHHASFNWARSFDGATTILDRSGAHVASAASVDVAWGALEHTGVVRWSGLVGNYKAKFFEWQEEGTPHPLGGGAASGRTNGYVWIPHTRVKLLADLAVQCRIPELEPMDSWTCATKVKLDRWAKHINAHRGVAIDRYGRESAEYGAVKSAFSTAISRLVGNHNVGEWRTWKGDIHRTDWAFTIKDLSAVTMWRWCDELGAVARAAGSPELAPVGIQHADELVIPADALELFTTTPRLPRPGATKERLPLRLDETGKTLGTFKVKA